MRIQIVDSSSGEVVFVPSANQHLEAELLTLFDRKHGWWRPLSRRKFKQFSREIERVAGELRELTSQA